MNSFFFYGALLISASLFVSPATAAPGTNTPLTPEDVKARDLVQSLGNSRYKVRKEAARQLVQMGRMAKRALIEGKKSSDPEIWNRCGLLLPQALELDLKARVEAFLADTDGKQQHDLPLWSRFRKITGSDAGARKLFAEIVKTNANMLDQCEEGPEVAGDKYNTRAQELQYQLNFGFRNGRQQTIQVPDIAALFLIGADPEASKFITNTQVNPVGGFLFQPNIQQTLRTGEQSPAFRKLFFSWAEQRDDVNSVSYILSVVQSLNLRKGLSFAVKAMQMKEQQVYTRAQAVTCVGKMGGKEHAASFDSLFNDTTQVGNLQWQNVMITTNMSDVVLAMSIHLSGQNPKDFGFDVLQTQPNFVWAYHYLGFSTEAKRHAALVKAATTKELPASTRGAALLALMHYGKEKDFKLIEPFLKDTLVVATPTVDGKKINVEMRDVALAVGVAISKQDLNDYGYKAANKETKPKDVPLKDYYFTTNEKREAAQKKWKVWTASQPKK